MSTAISTEANFICTEQRKRLCLSRCNDLFWPVYLFSLLFSVVIPSLNIFDRSIPVGYILAIPVIIGSVFKSLALTRKSFIFRIAVFAALIVGQIIVGGIVSYYAHTGGIAFPTDVAQHYFKFFTMIGVALVAKHHTKITPKFVTKIFLITFTAILTIGLLQTLPSVGYSISSIYAPERHAVGSRIVGVAPITMSHGGLSALAFYLACSLGLMKKSSWPLLATISILALYNVVLTLSRAALLMLLSYPLLFIWGNAVIFRKIIRASQYFFYILLLTALLILALMPYYNEFHYISMMVYRFDKLSEQVAEGGNRYGQLLFAYSKFEYFTDYIFGLSRSYFNTFYSHNTMLSHIETEAAYVFCIHGITGFILHYSFIIYLASYFLKSARKMKTDDWLVYLCLSSFCVIIGYQIFGIGYFFFREIAVGLPPWIFFGATIGLVERANLNLAK